MPKFLIQKQAIANGRVRIIGQEAKHISKILRLKKGDPLDLTDGKGVDYSGLILGTSLHQVDIEIISEQPSATESPLKISLCSGMLKNQKMDEMIKNLTQLGIDEWIPFFCERSVPTPDSKGIEKKLGRWQNIAREAVKQCRRSRVPDILTPVDFRKVLDRTAPSDIKIAFWEGSDTPLKSLTVPSPAPDSRVAILIGPEGGFSSREIKMAQEKGFISFSLGPRILRAENASVCACALVQHILGDM
ncbi:RsmE family RNA methyltransferase [Desulfospira joergensenii]|uniref:RsmE family RNA methyltransferase n=1 Tax=Desulfospira joergensenii TaxID=53329 RepID=UPI0003B310A3|nr:RsmE family RNA methyltransferase [Desulfospira joergensenii]